ncbi:DUF1850 domain-containing protein [Aneurinibacillus tyrosinisolvens]|uniref:DUF1850 domain-containing protein n=1 Tax=Aneurinibacillus tyrosinisolvens TaxID=1443435 RepID=UPI00063FCAE0|nr:DUF1850 domain-containing protein [Aneurinibacillus tyrosinisolvens]
MGDKGGMRITRRMAKRFLIFAALLLLVIPRPFLILKDFKSQTSYAQIPIERDTRFTVEWTHSVEKTPWRETYVAGWPHGVKLIETSFRSYGAGVPADTGVETKVVNGWITAELSEQREQVIYLISRKDYKLIIGPKTIVLTKLVPRYTSLEITAAWRLWWWDLLIN